MRLGIIMHFSLNFLVLSTVQLINDEFYSLNISFDLNSFDDPIQNGEPDEFAQALLNILINAKDIFLSRAVPDPKITITMGTSIGKAVLSISDNGGGISLDTLDKMFEPYFTTKKPRQRKGTGLYIAKAVIEKKMGGRLRAPNLAEGAQFIMVFNRVYSEL